MSTQSTENIDRLELIPVEEILSDDNCRAGLLKFRVERLASEIEHDGGVNIPIEVETLPEGHESGKKYRTTVGHYRVAAVTELNASGAGLLMPAIVRQIGDPLTRLKRQISENLEREDMNPIDKATAMQKMLDLGASKMDVRKAFAVKGGRKGVRIQEASNSHINMMLSFLKFSPSIKAKIADGRLPIASAYELLKKSPDKYQEILDKAEAARLAELDKYDADEVKYLEGEKKLMEASKTADEAQAELDKATAEAEQLKADMIAKASLAAEARVASLAKTLSKEESKAAKEQFKTLKEEAEAAATALKERESIIEKATKKAETASEKAAASKAKLEAVRAKVPTKAAKAVTPADIKNAAKDTDGGGDTSGPVPLTRKQMLELMEMIAAPSGYLKVAEIGKAIVARFTGELKPGSLTAALAKITGEKK